MVTLIIFRVILILAIVLLGAEIAADVDSKQKNALIGFGMAGVLFLFSMIFSVE